MTTKLIAGLSGVILAVSMSATSFAKGHDQGSTANPGTDVGSQTVTSAQGLGSARGGGKGPSGSKGKSGSAGSKK